MNRAIKTFLLWLLITALPIQGMAAGIKAFCGPSHHAMLPALTTQAQHHKPAMQHNHSHSGDELSADDHHAASSAAIDPAPDAKQSHQSVSFSAGAACCFGAAAPPSTRFWNPALASSEAVAPPPAVFFTVYIPAGLERPPRPIPA